MRTLFVFAALLALAASQCTVDGNTYQSGAVSITFGSAVDTWIPTLFNWGDVATVSFGTFKQATATRWEVQEYGSASGGSCEGKGQYNLQFGGDCDSLTFTFISDPCTARSAAFSEDFELVDLSGAGDCAAVGTSLETTFRKSVASPHLSLLPTTIVFGQDEFAIVSAGDTGAIFQRWSLGRNTDGETTTIVDFGSVPVGLSCGQTRVGTYLSNWEEDCSVQFCGISDGCESRAELWHTIDINGFEPEEACPRPIDQPGLGGDSACSPSDDQWLKHPWDCIDQEIEGGCMFCRGIAEGKTVSLCLDRLGAQCEDIFATNARSSFCNLEFECPASTTAVSFVVFICSLLALLFF